MINNTMKGLFKGIRYISQFFDEEGTKEIEIGYPTDVVHVAHFGSDGATADAPSWMGEYKFTSANADGKVLEAPGKELMQLSMNSSGSARKPHRRRSSASDSPLASETTSSRNNRYSRRRCRHQSAGSSPSGGDFPATESSDGSFRPGRRHSKTSTTGRAAPPHSLPESLTMQKD